MGFLLFWKTKRQRERGISLFPVDLKISSETLQSGFLPLCDCDLYSLLHPQQNVCLFFTLATISMHLCETHTQTSSDVDCGTLIRASLRPFSIDINLATFLLVLRPVPEWNERTRCVWRSYRCAACHSRNFLKISQWWWQGVCVFETAALPFFQWQPLECEYGNWTSGWWPASASIWKLTEMRILNLAVTTEIFSLVND